MKRHNIVGLIIALVLLLICLLGVIPAALSSNLFFALPVIREKPIQVIVYDTGNTYVFEPGHEAYDALVDACYRTLGDEIGVSEVGWPDTRFDQVRESGVAVELIYSEPVKLPGGRVDMADPTRLFFPLEVPQRSEGVLRSDEIVFRGGQSGYWGLPIQVETLDHVQETVEQVMSEQQG